MATLRDILHKLVDHSTLNGDDRDELHARIDAIDDSSDDHPASQATPVVPDDAPAVGA